MTLYINHATQLPTLARSLTSTLSSPLADPFQAEVVCVPTVGVRDWLQQQLALVLGATDHCDGIVANIDMVFPNRFMAAALGQPIHATGPWDIERLTWTVLQVLDSGVVEVPGRGGATKPDGSNTRGTYSTARRIADMFDRYANNRPQMLQQWKAGHDGDGTEDERGAVVPLPGDHVWQARLWRAVRESIGVATIAEQFPDLIADLRSGRLEPALPERAALFGLSAVSSAQLALLQALAQVRDIYLHLIHPSPVAWRNCPHQLAGRLVPRANADAGAAVRHPLLRSWGRPPMETAALVGGIDAVANPPGGDIAPKPAAPARTTLQRLQAAIADDQEPDAADDTNRDHSIQVHACHGTTRQIEVLRDALGHLFAADPTLAPHQVLVLCPDLGRFAPLIPSVFQRSSSPIPVRVSDLSLGAANPIATALAALLTTVAGRCTGPDLIQLIMIDPVQRRLGLDLDDTARINRWINDLGTTWGLDKTHRAQWVPDQITGGTWSATLDRLLLGAAMPAPSPRIGPDGIVPFDDVDATAFATAGSLADLVSRLSQARSDCAADHGIARWVEILLGFVSEFFSVRPDDEWQIAEIIAGMNAVRDNAGPVQVPLSFADARTVLSGVLTDDRGRMTLRSGAITITSLVPVRTVPARVICLLGFDEASIRWGSFDGDDILGLRPCVGERDRRADGRHILLDALMAAEEHLIITCDGSDITTNRKLPFPVQLTELLDVIGAGAGPGGGPGNGPGSGPGSGIVIRHPRQAYDERNFVSSPGSAGPAGFEEGQPFSFDSAMLRAATARRTAVPATEPLPLLEPSIPESITLADLARSCTRPATTFLRQRLDARLPREPDEAEISIPIRFVGLDQYQLGNELLELHRHGIDEAGIQNWRQAHRQGGSLPPRSLADAVLDEAVSEVDIVLAGGEGVSDVRRLLSASGSFPIALHVPIPESVESPILIDELITGLDTHRLIRVSFVRPGQRPIVSAAIELAALVATEPQHPWEAVVVNRPSSGGRRATVSRLVPVDSPSRASIAVDFLQTALAFHLRALREPIPFFEKSSRTLFEIRTIDDEEFSRDILNVDAQFLWGQYTADDILTIPLRTVDEARFIASAAAASPVPCGRAQALADSFWHSFHAFIPPATDSPESSDSPDSPDSSEVERP